MKTSKIKKKFKNLFEKIKGVLFLIRIIFISVVAIGLYTTYKYVDSKYIFFTSLIAVHVFVFVLTYLLKEGFLKNKKKNFIKNYLENTSVVAITGGIFHCINFIVTFFIVYLDKSIYLYEGLVLTGIILSSILLQKISFFKII
ncbi:MAG: hypothetical protein AB7V77_02505 [Candidatus Woesearchaeota archaeon]